MMIVLNMSGKAQDEYFKHLLKISDEEHNQEWKDLTDEQSIINDKLELMRYFSEHKCYSCGKDVMMYKGSGLYQCPTCKEIKFVNKEI